MSLTDRAAAYNATCGARWPSSRLWVVQEQGRDVLYGVWGIGADYRNKSGFYGSYPPTLLARIDALFPDVAPEETLHAFSGSLPPGAYVRCDVRQDAELRCDVLDLPRVLAGRRFRRVSADPPYSRADAERYGTPPLHKGRAVRALAAATVPGGFLTWLDVEWPMHAKREWLTVGRIMVQRSTQHRVRCLFLFERTGEREA